MLLVLSYNLRNKSCHLKFYHWIGNLELKQLTPLLTPKINWHFGLIIKVIIILTPKINWCFGLIIKSNYHKNDALLKFYWIKKKKKKEEEEEEEEEEEDDASRL